MSAKFKTIKVNTNTTVGECFKKKREEHNVSLNEVSEKLKIKKSYLEDLEENNYKQLPPDVYVKGFIRAYAILVGFNAEKMIELFNREKAVNNKIINKINQKEKIYKHNKFSFSEYLSITPRLITVLITLVVLSFVGYYLWHQISSFSSAPYLVVSSPTADQISKEAEMVIAGQIEKDATLKINGKGVYVNFEGYFQETIIFKPGNNVLIIEATNRFGKTAIETRNIVYEKVLEDFIPFELEIKEDIAVEEKNLFQKEDLGFEGEIEFIGP
ncbi:MAG: helix-turn-helix domain-containing protein [Candidatus Pacebacteria bacterium]|nr:helix-turn-helix domain-containing protein [Candidatus Paceibacterota bacterium]